MGKDVKPPLIAVVIAFISFLVVMACFLIDILSLHTGDLSFNLQVFLAILLMIQTLLMFYVVKVNENPSLF